MRENKAIKKHYRKPLKVNKIALRTCQILFSAMFIALAGIIIYYGATRGWQALGEWFKSQWACMIAVILVIAATIAIWLYTLYKFIQKVGGKDDETKK